MVPLLMTAGLAVGCGGDETSDDASSDTAGSEPTTTAIDADATTDDDADASAENGSDPDPDDGSDDGDADDRPAPDDEPTAIEGTVVSADDGRPLADVVVTAADGTATTTTTTDDEGRFRLEVEPGPELLFRRPTWLPVIADTDGEATGELEVAMSPVVARGVRVSRQVAADRQRFDDLLDLIGDTTVNALVFDTKDESGTVQYATEVDQAHGLDAVDPVYRPADLVPRAIDEGLYPITRVVTFEDRIWAGADAEAKLAGAWVDPTDRANWDYPLALAEEACRLGFAEIQFDYVRYPAGRTAEVAASQVPATSDERASVIAAFLTEAGERLTPMGCGVSAAIFGIVMSSETDEGIGQTVEDIGPVVDALSPMLYPSHYGPGWLGFADPNDHPGPVIADALDDGQPRLDPATQLRPWIQAFYYNGTQIGAQITEAESRGAGWLLWNASGNYRADWLPAAP